MIDAKTKVIGIMAEFFQLKPDAVTMDLSAGDIPQWDSIGQLNLISTLEERLGIEFPIDELFELNSVQAIVASAEKLLKI